MIRSLRGLLVASVALCALAPAAYAQNIPYTPGAGGVGNTLGAVTCGSDKCPKNAPVDSGGGDATNPAAHSVRASPVDSGGGDMTDATNHAQKVNAPLSYNLTNPTSTLTLPATTTAYAANQLIASSATAGSVVVPSFSILNTAGGASIPRVRLSTNDATATAWGGVQVQVDFWSVPPTFTNGDRGAFLPATGTASHLATYVCQMSAEYGDGAYTECGMSPGGGLIKLSSGSTIYWTIQTLSVSGVTGASKVFTLTAEVGN